MGKNKVILITGVSGSGKTTVGNALAERMKVAFYDGDSFHPAANVAKMSSGIPLDDHDRQPWLKAINERIREKLPSSSLIIGCSALKEKYRGLLSEGIDPSSILWVHLQGNYELIYQRMTERAGHFMTADMLQSQFEAYEAPAQGLLLDVNQDLEKIIDQIISKLEMNQSDVGLIGLGVMGTSLARNIAGKGFSISIFNRHIEGKEEDVARKMAATYAELNQSKPFDDLEGFVASLHTPRKIILMVNAGEAVDDVIVKLTPLLNAGDVIVEGGNSHFRDTNERQKKLAALGIHFVGTGVSGGEEGALKGPSIMPGGSIEGFELVKDILFSIAARNESNEICCGHIGDGGAGHFVKMVHNGIEYAEMQLITEMYSHLRYDQEKDPEEIALVFELWNQGEANSYLLGITIDILRFKDTDGTPLINKISDVAGNKGTGSWTTITASELGVPVPATAEALFSRYLSSFNNDRSKYASLYNKEHNSIHIDPEHLRQAYMFCRIINHYQGIKLIKEASDIFSWHIDTAALLKIWSGGCIIRSSLLSIFRKGWSACGSDIMEHPFTRSLVNAHLGEIKQTISDLARSNRSYPVSSSCLEYFKMLITPRSSAYLIQAQRDYFGAHTYRRIDDPSGTSHHTNWY
ncbi:MAG TPA: NADP-dependent phosphogluconate dehydrogenase [Chitinophagaceae bacterium]|nr:NADP-dependent phosphogluconate dehydrogenase [Chitinophagaceae bacterium]